MWHISTDQGVDELINFLDLFRKFLVGLFPFFRHGFCIGITL